MDQWINHEKEVLAEIMERHEIEWEKKIENLTADVKVAESDIKALKQEKTDAEKAKDQVRESKNRWKKNSGIWRSNGNSCS